MIEIPIQSFLGTADAALQGLKAFVEQEYGEFSIQQLIEAQQARQLLAASEDFRVITPSDLDTFETYLRNWSLSVQNAIVASSTIPSMPEECTDVLKAAVFSPSTLNMLPLQMMMEAYITAHAGAARARVLQTIEGDLGLKIAAATEAIQVLRADTLPLLSGIIDTVNGIGSSICLQIGYVSENISYVRTAIDLATQKLDGIRSKISTVGDNIAIGNIALNAIDSTLADMKSAMDAANAKIDALVIACDSISGSALTATARLIDYDSVSIGVNLSSIKTALGAIQSSLAMLSASNVSYLPFLQSLAGEVEEGAINGVLQSIADKFDVIIAESLPGIISSIGQLILIISGGAPLAAVLQGIGGDNSQDLQAIEDAIQAIVEALTGSEGNGIAAIVEAIQEKLPFTLNIRLSTVKADDAFTWGIDNG